HGTNYSFPPESCWLIELAHEAAGEPEGALTGKGPAESEQAEKTAKAIPHHRPGRRDAGGLARGHQEVDPAGEARRLPDARRPLPDPRGRVRALPAGRRLPPHTGGSVARAADRRRPRGGGPDRLVP